MLAKSLTGDEITRELINTLTCEYGIQSEQIIAVMHDCASANDVAICTYPFNVSLSHALNQVGEKFNILNVNEVTTYWISLFSHSSKAQILWKQWAGCTVHGYT